MLEWAENWVLRLRGLVSDLACNYRKASNIRRTKCQNINPSRLVLQLPFYNILKPSAKWRVKMYLGQRRQAMLRLHLSDQQLHCLYIKPFCLRYAGVQNGGDCYCGNSYGRHGVANETQCHVRCKGWAHQNCGGDTENAIYVTEIRKYHSKWGRWDINMRWGWKQMVTQSTDAQGVNVLN